MSGRSRPKNTASGSTRSDGDTINLFMDYETFGEHQWADTGIFQFLEKLPEEVFKIPNLSFKTPSETIASYDPKDSVDMPHIVTWADSDRDLTAWVENPMQKAAIEAVYALEQPVMYSNDVKMIEDWRRLQTSPTISTTCAPNGSLTAMFMPISRPMSRRTMRTLPI